VQNRVFDCRPIYWLDFHQLFRIAILVACRVVRVNARNTTRIDETFIVSVTLFAGAHRTAGAFAPLSAVAIQRLPAVKAMTHRAVGGQFLLLGPTTHSAHDDRDRAAISVFAVTANHAAVFWSLAYALPSQASMAATMASFGVAISPANPPL